MGWGGEGRWSGQQITDRKFVKKHSSMQGFYIKQTHTKQSYQEFKVQLALFLAWANSMNMIETKRYTLLNPELLIPKIISAKKVFSYHLKKF